MSSLPGTQTIRRKFAIQNLQKENVPISLEPNLFIGYLIGSEDTGFIEIFGRINSISKTLNQQEKGMLDIAETLSIFAFERQRRACRFGEMLRYLRQTWQVC